MRALWLTHFRRTRLRVSGFALVAVPLGIFAACNSVLGIGEPKDRPDETGGRAGNAGSQGGHGGESGDGRGGSGGSRTGGSSGSGASGGRTTGASGGGSGGEDAGYGGVGGEDAGDGGVGGTAAGNGGAGGSAAGSGGVGGSAAGSGGVGGSAAGSGGAGGSAAGSGGAGGSAAGSGGVGGSAAGSGGVGGSAAGSAGVSGSGGRPYLVISATTVEDSTIQIDEPDQGFAASCDARSDRACLLRWDLSSIPPGSSVEDVLLAVNIPNPSPTPLSAYPLRVAWSEQYASWIIRDVNASWEVPGANGSLDRGSLLGSLYFDQEGPRAVPLDLEWRALVQSWVDAPSTNYGIILTSISTTNGVAIASKEDSDPLSRPRLLVTYLPPAP